jgi:anti-sigma factor RsiW
MSSIEEKLWNYIDGTCTPDEQEAIARLIAQDEIYRRKYNELLKLNAEFAAIELDEPPMAFTYNVMEAIRTENAQQPLKAAINKNIIRGIGLFFVITISAMLILVFSSIHWHVSATTGTPVASTVLPRLKGVLSGPLMEVFVFFDVVLGLYLLDGYLRKRSQTKIEDSVQTSGQHKH